MTRDNNPNRLDDGARAEAEMKEREAIPHFYWEVFCGQAKDTKDDAVAAWNRRSAAPHPLPAPQGDDGLVAEAAYMVENPSAWESFDQGGSDMIAKLIARYRSQAAEIERWAKNALDNDDSRIAAEARLADARAALEFYADKENWIFPPKSEGSTIEIACGKIEFIAPRDKALAPALKDYGARASATLSRLTAAEKKGGK